MNYLTSGLEDLIKSFKDHLRWLTLGYLDIKLRYRRSIIGPIWNTINIGLIIFVLSLIWPEIISIDKNFFVPYFTIGYILWFWINTIIYESMNAFLEFEAIYKQIIVPTYSIFLRIWFRNLIILAHNIIIILLVFLWFDSSYLENFNLFSYLIYFIIISFSLIFSGLILAFLCLRYRDLINIFITLMQLMFFITPIIWHPEIISRNEFIYELNPIYHWINLLRDPLIGKNDLTNSIYISVIVLLLLFSLSIYFTGKFKNKIFYWL